MKQYLLFAFLFIGLFSNSQSLVQTVNSGSVLGAVSAVSVGEIFVVPQNQNLSSSGLIGILVQINQQNLEVDHLDLSAKITVYPNPTLSKIFFEAKESLLSQKVTVFNTSGQLVLQKQLSADNSVDLTDLASGTYLVQLSENKSDTFKIIKH